MTSGLTWLRQLLEWQRDLKSDAEFMETVKVDSSRTKCTFLPPRET
jgi:(p)ppGpp synthase/HD superfamily hydrolase